MTVACIAATISLMSMNREEAKDILSAYRTSGEDASDPQFQEALILAIQDPEMARWFEQEQAWDLQISKKLRELPVSTDLRDQLLASLTMSDRPSQKARSHPWRRLWWCLCCLEPGEAVCNEAGERGSGTLPRQPRQLVPLHADVARDSSERSRNHKYRKSSSEAAP